MPTWIDELKRKFEPAILSEDSADLHDHSCDYWPVALKMRSQGRTPYLPDVVARPRTTGDVSRLLAWANERLIPVTPWGGGSGVTGAALPLNGGICLDMTAMNKVLDLNEANLLVQVQAGLLGAQLEQALNARGYTLAHSPQSLDRSTVGGWVATRATGQFSSRWGGMEDLLASLTVVLADGEIIRTLPGPRAALGPDLKSVFLGSEGTLGVVTEVTMKIFPFPEQRILETFRFPSLAAGLAALQSLTRLGLRPFLARLYDDAEARRSLGGAAPTDPAPGGFLMLGFAGPSRVAEAEYAAGLDLCAAQDGERLGPAAAERWMQRRFDFSMVEGILARPGGYAETIEVAHFWDSILPLYEALKAGLAPLADEVLGHFSHIYPQGTSLYLILLGQAKDDPQAQERLTSIWDAAMKTCLAHSAVLSHHHGVGLARRSYLRLGLGSEFILLERLKQTLDPNGILNPGKLDLGGTHAP